MDIDFSPAAEQLQQMIEDFITVLPNILAALIVFLLLYLLSKGIGWLVQRLTRRRHRYQNVAYVFGRLAQWFVAFLGFLIALVIAFPNFTPAQMIQLLGISGIALGFAFRDILVNLFGGILLLVSNAFQIGDQIIVEKVEGTVEDIEMRATMIRTYDGRLVVMPNAKLFTNVVTVNTAYRTRRIECDLGISYENEIYHVKQIILEAIRSIDDVLQAPEPDVLVVEIGGSGVVLRARWWITPPRRMDALAQTDKVLSAIKSKLAKNGVEMSIAPSEAIFQSLVKSASNSEAGNEG